MATTDTREAKRTPVTLKIKFKSESLDQFIERYSVDISHGGIFIRTKDPLSVGTTLRFEFQLKDATPLITGEGTVVWTREHDPARAGVAPGMGVRFDRLPGDSQKVLDQILDHKSGPAQDDDDDEDDDGEFKDTPTRVAPAQLVDKLVNQDFGESSDRTPLPRPMPFHSDADDFSDETFEEATRVASLDSLVASTKSDEDDDGDDDAGEGVESETAQAAAMSSAAEPATPSADDESETAPVAASTAAEVEADDRDGADVDDSTGLDDDDDDLAAAGTARDDDEDRATVTPAAEPVEDTGGSMPWIAAAAAILIIGGVGGFWFLNQSREKNAHAQQEEAADRTMTAAAAAVPEEAPKEVPDVPAEPDEPPVETVPVEIETVPEGATVELVGSDQRSPSPATFELEEGKSYEVEVSHPGFVAQTLEVSAGEDVPPVKLEAMKKIVRVTSKPAGAVVLVNGRRQRGVTPLDVEITRRLARKDGVRIAVRRAGYQTWAATVSTESDFDETDGALVQSVTADLERRVAARRPPRPDSDDGAGDADGASGDDDGKSETGDEADPAATPETEPTKPEAKPATPEAKPAKPETKPAKPEPKPAKPDGEATTPETKPAGAPTPDWMK